MDNQLSLILHKICRTCKKEKHIYQFNKVNLNDQEITKTCSECIKKRQKYKCEHNKRKGECKYCGGSEICEHRILKRHCKQCKGSGICEHNRCRYTCKECGGKQICEHNKDKRHCKICSPNVYKIVDTITDDVFEVKANWRSKQFSFDMPADLKKRKSR